VYAFSKIHESSGNDLFMLPDSYSPNSATYAIRIWSGTGRPVVHTEVVRADPAVAAHLPPSGPWPGRGFQGFPPGSGWIQDHAAGMVLGMPPAAWESRRVRGGRRESLQKKRGPQR